MRPLAFCSILFYFLFISCSSDDAETLSPEDPSFYGLNVGAEWEYHYYRRLGIGEDFEFSGIKSTHTVIGKIEMNNKTVFGIQTITEGEGSCVGCPSPGVSEDKQIVSQNNLYGSNLDQLVFFIGYNIGDEIIQENQSPLSMIRTYKGAQGFEGPYGDYSTEVNSITASLPDGEIVPAKDYVKVAPGVGIVYRTYSFATYPEPSTKVYLANYTSGN